MNTMEDNKMQLIKKTVFDVLKPSEEEKQLIITANKTIDDKLNQGYGNWNELKEYGKNRGVYRLTVMYGPKECNFKCPKYCYTKGLAQGVLSQDQTKEVIDQVAEMGAKVVYWPGLGEVTLSKDFWKIQDYICKKGMKSVVFTNGSVFWNDVLAKKNIRLSSDELIEKARNLGIHFYVKYWNSNPEKAAEMSGIRSGEYPFVEFKGRNIPRALYNLMQKITKERIGVETMVSKENYENVVANIVPTINELNINGFIEPIIFSGKAEGRQDELGLSAEQYKHFEDTFVSGGKYCEKRQTVEMILLGDSLSAGIAIPPKKEHRVIDEIGKVKEIFKMYHNPYFRKVRKISEELDGCLCRAFWDGEIKL